MDKTWVLRNYGNSNPIYIFRLFPRIAWEVLDELALQQLGKGGVREAVARDFQRMYPIRVGPSR